MSRSKVRLLATQVTHNTSLRYRKGYNIHFCYMLLQYIQLSFLYNV